MHCHNLFPNYFFWKFEAPNFEEFINILEQEELEQNNFESEWQQLCDVSKNLLSKEKYVSLLQPSLQHLGNYIGKSFKVDIDDPWVNLYQYGGFQEVHDHAGVDLTCVFFLNQGENFSKFYFVDRNNVTLTRPITDLLNLINFTYVDYKAGDILFFPSHMLHGVTKHLSKEVRKSFSCNMRIELL